MPPIQRLSITDSTLLSHQGFQTAIHLVSDNCKELLQVAKQAKETLAQLEQVREGSVRLARSLRRLRVFGS